MEIHGNFYGAGGVGGVENDVSGKPGGNAISISGGRVYFDIQPNAKIWAGGGGGEFGGSGTPGAAGTCEKIVERTKCPDQGSPSCPDPFVQIGSIRDTGICCQKSVNVELLSEFLVLVHFVGMYVLIILELLHVKELILHQSLLQL